MLTTAQAEGFELGKSAATDSWPRTGLPRLPSVASEAHFTILRNWLQECDQHHEDCKPIKGTSPTPLPTRLIDVGEKGGDMVRLYETAAGDAFEYLALSHIWGPPPHFCTLSKNLAEHRRGIPLEALPKTFQDAVEVTRNLDHRYLWIDSICIVNDSINDWGVESQRLEQTFNHAYCVLNASCASGPQDGFMKPRRERSCMKIQHSRHSSIYACEFIDKFQEDALDSNLNQRAWVLQERALAQRAIFFTEGQTYWECGAGVRCETITRMNK